MALLEVRNLSVGIRQKNKYLPAVRGIDFDINAGEIIALAGESGGGKTLSALAIPRLLPPVAKILSGEITFNSVPLFECAEKELRRIRGRQISMIFQEPRQSLNPLIRIGTQITESLELHGEKNRLRLKREALEMLEAMGFDEAEKIYRAYPHQLSLGMCQRVMIAIAAICKPRLLIADEAAASLDQETQNHILDILSRMNREYGTAILYISHDLHLIRSFCSRCLIMYGGKIVEEGPGEKIISSPQHPYTQSLISSIPGREQRGNPLPVMPGRGPSIEDSFSGCPFAPRFPRAQSLCREAFPPPSDMGGGQRVYCHYPENGQHQSPGGGNV